MAPVVCASITSGWIKTCCSICEHNQCGLIVRVDDGIVKEIMADRSNPVSEGAVCPKGLASIQLLQHPARLKSPLIREGRRGQRKWREVSWDEALTLVAGRLEAIRKESGPKAVVMARRTNRGF